MDQNSIEIYQSDDNQIQVNVKFEQETIWLNQKQMALLFGKDSDTIGLHFKNIYKEGELDESSTTEYFSVVQKEGKREVRRNIKFYNLDAVISVGYRVNSKLGTQFRIWATERLKDYLVKGYAINEKRLKQQNLEIQHLKTGISILSRAIESEAEKTNSKMLQLFSKGLAILDDYDHEELDERGTTRIDAIYPEYEDYMSFIDEMYSDFQSDVFAKPKDDSFRSSIGQIKQSFADKELVPHVFSIF